MNAHHFFGSTSFNWAVGATRQEVIDKLAKWLGNNTGVLAASSVKNVGGVYCYTVKVNATIDYYYDIENFAPKGVDTCDSFGCNIVNKNGSIKLID